MNNFDWSEFETEPDENLESSTMPEMFDWSEFENVQKEETSSEGYLESIEKVAKQTGRHTARIASRVAETLVGMPGDIVNLIEWTVNKLPKPPQFMQPKKNIMQEYGKKFLQSLPTSTDLKELSSEITGGFTDPQGTWEEFGDGVIELASALGVGKDPTKIKNVLVPLGKALVAKTASETAKVYGATENQQFASELGTLVLMSLMNKPMANKFASDKLKNAIAKIPRSDVVQSKNLFSNLVNLEKELSKGISTATKNEVKNSVSELKNKAANGTLKAEELVTTYHDINEKMLSKKLFDELSTSEKKKLKFRYDRFKDIVSKDIKEYGKTNPEFYKEWLEGNEAFSVVENSKTVSKFIESNLGKIPKNVASGMALELFLGKPLVAASIGGSYAALKTGEMLYRISKSSSLQKHYLAVYEAALKENVPAMINSLEKLDQELKESFADIED